MDDGGWNYLNKHSLLFFSKEVLSFKSSFSFMPPSLLLLLYFQLGETLLLYHDLVLHLIILVDSHIDLRTAWLELRLHGLGLLSLLPLGEVYGLLDLPLLLLPRLLDHVVSLWLLLLLLDVQLQIIDFLHVFNAWGRIPFKPYLHYAFCWWRYRWCASWHPRSSSRSSFPLT